MATRHVTYQFDWGFATYDRNIEQTQINIVESEKKYLNKFDVSINERELIDDADNELYVENDALKIVTVDGVEAYI